MIGIILATVLVSLPLYPADKVKDAQSLSDYMRAEFTYKDEGEGVDVWQTPEETAKLKTFDCEDASFFSEKVLKQLGYQEVQAIAIYGKQNGEKYFHAITIFKTKNGKYQYFSNCYVSYFKEFESVNDIIEFECPEWKWYGFIYLPHEIKNFHHKVITY
jgi:hypothetical protein